MAMDAGRIDPATLRALQAVFSTPQLCLREMDLEANRAIFTPMTRAGYFASSFLDDRIQRAGSSDVAIPLSMLLRALPYMARLNRQPRYLFHIGHCGSTLLSRLLAEWPGVLPVREPPPLLDLAQMLRFRGTERMGLSREQWGELFELAVVMLARSYDAAESAMVKPISHANNLIIPLLRRHPDTMAVLLYVDLPTYLASMLRPASRPETRIALRESRTRDLQVAAGDRFLSPQEWDDGQAAALVWLLQMREFEQALRAEGVRDRLLTIHFDDFLANPEDGLARIANFFGLTSGNAEIDHVLRGSTLRAYAKSPGHAYSPESRARELRGSVEMHALEIDRAIAWTSDLADSCAALATSTGLSRNSRLRLFQDS